MERYLLGISLGVIGALVWSVGRSLKMVPPEHRRWRGRRSPTTISCIGLALIFCGEFVLGIQDYLAALAYLGFFAALSFLLQVWGFRIATGMYARTWAAKNPEFKAGQSKKEPDSEPKPVNLKKLRKQYRGCPYAHLIRHYMGRQNTEELLAGAVGTTEFLPATARPLVEGFIDRWNVRVYDRAFWNTDCAEVFDAILEDARTLLIAASAPTDDETLFNMFQIVSLNYAYSASDQPKMREFMGI